MYKYLFLLCVFCNTSFGQYPLNLSKENIKLPKIEDKYFESKLNDKDTIFYKLEPIWQHYIPSSTIEQKDLVTGKTSYLKKDMVWGLHRTEYLSEFNANNDFPWEGTFGLNKGTANNIKTVNFLILPKENDKIKPVLLIRDKGKPYIWIFPTETIIGELILLQYKNEWLTQEVRARIKTPGDFYWEPIIFRPIKNRDHLQKIVGDYNPASKYMFFRNTEEEEVFKVEGLVERLPNLKEDQVLKILGMEFQNVTYEDWSDVSSAPCSDIDFNILPKDYNLGLIKPDQDNCINCHKQTQISVSNLIPKEPLIINNPEKVGNIRGSDSVFTWYPFHTDAVSLNLSSKSTTMRFREYDIVNKTIMIWEADKLKNPELKDYRLTEFVQSSLRSYELPNNKVLHIKE